MTFQLLLACHVLAGITATLAGAAAMLVRKRRGRHTWPGTVYLAALLVIVVTASGMGALHWPRVNHLLILAGIALAGATLGYAARRVAWRGWLPYHITGMGISYIAMLTAFYVDSGPNLPLWRLLPPIAFWFLPAAVGLPILVHALIRHRPGRRTPAPPRS
ncbi:hypothetical protein [Allosalinactinospora lopnorensis]|uniref:hypothetical protein n=1 Tax=Allosalinactinospora lopnorensis TaxID=1352348 RepID=UPI000623BB38|nr:hypothetical protein [Allosalinactinospora lopnorensis]